MFNPAPKPVKKEKVKMTSAEFRQKYGQKANLKKSSGIKALIDEADDWFSRRVRLEECDSNYIARCVDCGTPVDIRRADCGHYHSRRHKSTRWERTNCGVQKKLCNMRMNDPKVNDGFKKELIRRHGQRAFDALEIKKGNTVKPDRVYLEYEISNNKAIVERLLKDKGLKKWW